jgi:hypothetical protein
MILATLAFAFLAHATPNLTPAQLDTFEALHKRAGLYHLAQNSAEMPCLFQDRLDVGPAVELKAFVVPETTDFEKAGDVEAQLLFTGSGIPVRLFDRSSFIGVNLGTRRSVVGATVISHNSAYDARADKLTESTSMTGVTGGEEALQTVTFTERGFTYDYTLVTRNAVGFKTKTEAYDHCEFRK